MRARRRGRPSRPTSVTAQALAGTSSGSALLTALRPIETTSACRAGPLPLSSATALVNPGGDGGAIAAGPKPAARAATTTLSIRAPWPTHDVRKVSAGVMAAPATEGGAARPLGHRADNGVFDRGETPRSATTGFRPTSWLQNLHVCRLEIWNPHIAGRCLLKGGACEHQIQRVWPCPSNGRRRPEVQTPGGPWASEKDRCAQPCGRCQAVKRAAARRRYQAEAQRSGLRACRRQTIQMSPFDRFSPVTGSLG